MLRTATIALLVILNVSLWLGPAELFMHRTSAIVKDTPSLERAGEHVYHSRLRPAMEEYRALAEMDPTNGIYRYEYGNFCYINGHYLQEEAGWTREQLAKTVSKELLAARTLLKNDYNIALSYAYTYLDEELHPECPRQRALEAWEHVFELAVERRGNLPVRSVYGYDEAQALLNLARVELTAGNNVAARKYIDRIDEVIPHFSVPDDVIARAYGESESTVVARR